jgi:hypothetical protein
VLPDCREPVLVWAVTVVLSSASLFEPVEAEDAELFSSELELEDGDSTVACPSDAADELGLSAGEVCDPAPSADDPPESEPPEPDDDSCDAWPESSARATLTCGPASDTPNSAALTPAEAAPSCNHDRTPKLCDRRRLFDRLARCLPPPPAFPLAISDPRVNCWYPKLTPWSHVRSELNPAISEMCVAASVKHDHPVGGAGWWRHQRREMREQTTAIRSDDVNRLSSANAGSAWMLMAET